MAPGFANQANAHANAHAVAYNLHRIDQDNAYSTTSSMSSLESYTNSQQAFGRFSRRELEFKCDQLIERALEEQQFFHSKDGEEQDVRWKLYRQRDALSLYRRQESAPVAPRLLCSGFLPGTLEDTMLGVFCDSTDTMRTSQTLLSPHFLDGSILHIFEKHSIRAPIVFAGIKWFALRCPGGGQTTANRDVVCFERMGCIQDARGQTFTYHVMQSIDMQGGQTNERRVQHGEMKRATISICYLYRQVCDSWIGCFMLGDFDAGGAIPTKVAEYIGAEFVLSVGGMLKCANAKRFSNLKRRHADKIRSAARTCDLCGDFPGMFASLAKALPHCEGCHRRACKMCRTHCALYQLDPRTQRPDKVWFCRDCVRQVVGKTMPGVPENNQSRSSSSLSGDDSSRATTSSELEHDDSFTDFDLDALAKITQRGTDVEDDFEWNQSELSRVSKRLDAAQARLDGMDSSSRVKSKATVSELAMSTRASSTSSASSSVAPATAVPSAQSSYYSFMAVTVPANKAQPAREVVAPATHTSPATPASTRTKSGTNESFWSRATKSFTRRGRTPSTDSADSSGFTGNRKGAAAPQAAPEARSTAALEVRRVQQMRTRQPAPQLPPSVIEAAMAQRARQPLDVIEAALAQIPQMHQARSNEPAAAARKPLVLLHEAPKASTQEVSTIEGAILDNLTPANLHMHTMRTAGQSSPAAQLPQPDQEKRGNLVFDPVRQEYVVVR